MEFNKSSETLALHSVQVPQHPIFSPLTGNSPITTGATTIFIDGFRTEDPYTLEGNRIFVLESNINCAVFQYRDPAFLIPDEVAQNLERLDSLLIPTRDADGDSSFDTQGAYSKCESLSWRDSLASAPRTGKR